MHPASDPADPADRGATATEPVDLRPPAFDQLPPDIRAQLELVLAPVERIAADLDRTRADNAAHLEAERARGLDPEIERTLSQAARNPDAPASLKRVAHEVSLGKLGWDDVFGAGARTDDPHIAEVRRDTFDTARAHFDNDDWKVEIVAVDPDGPPPRRGTWLE